MEEQDKYTLEDIPNYRGAIYRAIVASSPEVTGQVGSMISVGDLSSIDFETNIVE